MRLFFLSQSLKGQPSPQTSLVFCVTLLWKSTTDTKILMSRSYFKPLFKKKLSEMCGCAIQMHFEEQDLKCKNYSRVQNPNPNAYVLFSVGKWFYEMNCVFSITCVDLMAKRPLFFIENTFLFEDNYYQKLERYY